MDNGELFYVTGQGDMMVNVKTVKAIGGIDNMTRRLVSLWLEMSDYYRNLGWSWYSDANIFAQFLSDTYGYTLWQIAQVIAALSPQNPWDGKYTKVGKRVSDGNRLCAVKVIDAFFHHGESAVLALVGKNGWGYSGEFLRKSIKALQGETIDWTGAPKTYRFALLIADPTRTDIAVIDSHASRIATGNVGGRYHVVQKGAYPLIEQAYMKASIILGIPAYVLQAGTWTMSSEGLLY